MFFFFTFCNDVSYKFYDEYKMTVLVSCRNLLAASFLDCSVREREEDLYLAATNKLIHGGPRVHDGKYRHWSHVLL